MLFVDDSHTVTDRVTDGLQRLIKGSKVRVSVAKKRLQKLISSYLCK